MASYPASSLTNDSQTTKTLDRKVCLITGGTSGIGKETALALARMGAIIVLPARNMELAARVKQEIIEQTGNTLVDIMPCDMASMVSIIAFANAIKAKYDRLHILINNAGIMQAKRKVSRDGIELIFAVNHLAPFLLTKLLLDLMKVSAPARIINVASEAHENVILNFDDLESRKTYSSFKVYGQSKLANILFTLKLSQMLMGTGVTANSLHPGVVATNIFNVLPPVLRHLAKWFMLTPAQGAETTVYLASSPEVENMTGEYFNKKKIAYTSSIARDTAVAERLWVASEAFLSV